MQITNYAQGHEIKYEVDFPCYFKNEYNTVYFKDKNNCQVITIYEMGSCSISNDYTSNWVQILSIQENTERTTKDIFLKAKIEALNSIARFMSSDAIPVQIVTESCDDKIIKLYDPTVKQPVF